MDDQRIARGRRVSRALAAPRATASGIAQTIGPSIIRAGHRPRRSGRRLAACAALRRKRPSAATRFTDMRSAQGSRAGGISDWSGKNGWASNGQPDPQGSRIPAGRFQTESGAPFCAKARGVKRRRHHDRRHRSAQSDRADHQLPRSDGSRQYDRRRRVRRRRPWPLSASSS